MADLQPPVYGLQGPWAINIWIKAGSLLGSQFQYIFSQNNTNTNASNPWADNKVTAAWPRFAFHVITVHKLLSLSLHQC